MNRSISNMVEVLIRDHCARNGIAIQTPSQPGPSEDKAPRS
ncbi:hypothetical protein D779_1056 [Imhoffiella purpurea]|uniref:Uncharacterized protein n=1 Tax=Imhoffiella purpurea TaxID=1249627 RepID=W9VIH2_9GAMM|nr:hypothetical protein D779_1056 [Imhoffiella purpurea]